MRQNRIHRKADTPSTAPPPSVQFGYTSDDLHGWLVAALVAILFRCSGNLVNIVELYRSRSPPGVGLVHLAVQGLHPHIEVACGVGRCPQFVA